ncbi:MAG: PstS family phosphate ABC transporter substrate-binding protein [Leptolyngbyaceae cyanobacterium bins.349]|nr:PstS family phosphate ABC transporter substrate-binding protein [Leptolyngbyaceae cyanobacterium bins.349]
MLSFNPTLKLGFSLFTLVVAATALSACASSNATSSKVAAGGAIKIDGSSTVYPVTDAIAKEYARVKSGTTIEVQFSGTSAGFDKFCAGETQISNASRPILLQEAKVCANSEVPFIELPIAFDALTLAVNPQNDWAKDITLDELRKIWEPGAAGQITNWNQIRSSYPNRPLNLFGAGQNSGTYDYFNEVVVGNAEASRQDYTSSEDDTALVAGIEQDPNALGYIPFAYFEAAQGRLKALGIDNGQGAVLPSREAVANAKYQPFSRPLFIYINAKAAQENPQLQAFVEYYLTHVGRISNTVGYIPLPAEAYRLATIQFTRGEIGTVFEGVPQPNVTIAELLRRQAIFQLAEEQKTEQSSQ